MGGELYDHTMALTAVALDAAFWQAPDKSLLPEAHYHALYLNSLGEKTERWAHIASIFYARILQGQSTEDFWKELLS